MYEAGQLDAFALARPPGCRHSRVAVENRLAGEVEHKERAFEFEIRQRLRPYSDLVAGRLGQQRGLALCYDGWVALHEFDFGRQSVDIGQGATQIVAVKTLADTEVIFGVLPWSEDQIPLRTRDGLDNLAGIGLEGAFVRSVIEILSKASHGPEFVRPLDPIFASTGRDMAPSPR